MLTGHPLPPHPATRAGGNAGFSSLLFKLLWPGATVVALEPDPSNYAVLQRNTAGCVRAHPPRAPACCCCCCWRLCWRAVADQRCMELAALV